MTQRYNQKTDANFRLLQVQLHAVKASSLAGFGMLKKAVANSLNSKKDHEILAEKRMGFDSQCVMVLKKNGVPVDQVYASIDELWCSMFPDADATNSDGDGKNFNFAKGFMFGHPIAMPFAYALIGIPAIAGAPLAIAPVAGIATQAFVLKSAWKRYAEEAVAIMQRLASNHYQGNAASAANEKPNDNSDSSDFIKRPGVIYL